MKIEKAIRHLYILLGEFAVVHQRPARTLEEFIRWIESRRAT